MAAPSLYSTFFSPEIVEESISGHSATTTSHHLSTVRYPLSEHSFHTDPLLQEENHLVPRHDLPPSQSIHLAETGRWNVMATKDPRSPTQQSFSSQQSHHTRSRYAKAVLKGLITLWGIYTLIRYFLAYVYYLTRSRTGSAVSLALATSSTVALGFLLASIFISLYARHRILFTACSSQADRKRLELIRNNFTFFTSFLIFAPAAINFALVWAWRNSQEEVLRFRGRCVLDIDVVWSVVNAGRGNDCPASSGKSWGWWVGLSAARLVITLGILILYHILSRLHKPDHRSRPPLSTSTQFTTPAPISERRRHPSSASHLLPPLHSPSASGHSGPITPNPVAGPSTSSVQFALAPPFPHDQSAVHAHNRLFSADGGIPLVKSTRSRNSSYVHSPKSSRVSLGHSDDHPSQGHEHGYDADQSASDHRDIFGLDRTTSGEYQGSPGPSAKAKGKGPAGLSPLSRNAQLPPEPLLGSAGDDDLNAFVDRFRSLVSQVERDTEEGLILSPHPHALEGSPSSSSRRLPSHGSPRMQQLSSLSINDPMGLNLHAEDPDLGSSGEEEEDDEVPPLHFGSTPTTPSCLRFTNDDDNDEELSDDEDPPAAQYTVPFTGFDEFGRPNPPDETIRVLSGFVKRMPTIESIGSREMERSPSAAGSYVGSLIGAAGNASVYPAGRTSRGGGASIHSILTDALASQQTSPIYAEDSQPPSATSTQSLSLNSNSDSHSNPNSRPVTRNSTLSSRSVMSMASSRANSLSLSHAASGNSLSRSGSGGGRNRGSGGGNRLLTSSSSGSGTAGSGPPELKPQQSQSRLGSGGSAESSGTMGSFPTAISPLRTPDPHSENLDLS